MTFRDKISQIEGVNIEHRFSNSVYTLVQLSVQSGPFTGGKPGYFKRKKHMHVPSIRLAHFFLENIIAIGFQGFSEKQTKSLETWSKNALKQLKKEAVKPFDELDE